MELAQRIEHTLLKPEATVKDIMRLCDEAQKYHLYAVCVNPCYVPLAKHLLQGTEVKVVTVVGFPLGATFSSVKALEAKTAMEEHADEIDMVMNVSAFKTGDYAAVTEDIRRVVEAAAPCPVKLLSKQRTLLRVKTHCLPHYCRRRRKICKNLHRFRQRRRNCGGCKTFARRSRQVWFKG